MQKEEILHDKVQSEILTVKDVTRKLFKPNTNIKKQPPPQPPQQSNKIPASTMSNCKPPTRKMPGSSHLESPTCLGQELKCFSDKSVLYCSQTDLV